MARASIVSNGGIIKATISMRVQRDIRGPPNSPVVLCLFPELDMRYPIVAVIFI
jgi:hypothetical protein